MTVEHVLNAVARIENARHDAFRGMCERIVKHRFPLGQN